MVRRKANRRFYMIVLSAIIVVLVVALIVILSTTDVVSGSGGNNAPIDAKAVFAGGVTVNGISVGGMKYEDGRAAVEKAVNTEIAGIEYSITDGEVSRVISAAAMNVTADTAEALQNAIQYKPQRGKSGDGDQNFPITLAADRDALLAHIRTFAAEFNKEPVEPSAEPQLDDNNKASFTYHEGENGRELNAEAVADKLLLMLAAREYKGEIRPEYTPLEPKMDIDWLKNNTKKRSEYTTRFKYNSADEVVRNRCFNVQKGADLLNSAVIQMDEEFSFNGHVGLRTEKAGWKLANGISGGKEYTLQAGGGICQVSTTLYNALLCADIEVTSRKKHSIPSDYVPKGLDATVDSSGIDLKFRNNTNAPLYIFAYVTNDSKSSRYRYMHVVIYGEPLPEGVEYKTRSEVVESIPRDEPIYTDDPTIPIGYQVTKVIKHDGYVAESYQDKYQDGKLVASKKIDSNTYRGNNAEIAVGKGDPATVAPPAAAELVPGFEPAATPTPEGTIPPTESEQPAEQTPSPEQQ